MKRKDCIVIGGGIIGMSTARALALRGLTVALFDKDKLGQEASWAAGGILSSMRPWTEEPYSAELSDQGKACYTDFVTELQQQTGIDTEYQRCGLLITKQEDVELSKQWLQDKQVADSEHCPILPIGMCVPAETIFLPEISQIRVSKLLKALYASLLKLGVDIFTDTPISVLDIETGYCSAVHAAKEKYHADIVVVAAGAWSQQLLGKAYEDIKIVPVLGQMLCVKFAEQVLDPIVLDGAHYLIPRKDGHVLIGSTMEYVGFKKQINDRARNHLMRWASQLWPDIADATFIKQWAGLRPGNHNGRPYLGKLRNCQNVYINAGHFRKGILQAPACAKVIADMIC